LRGHNYQIFRSTLRQSRSNKASLKCPSVRPCVHTHVRPSIHKVPLISMKFGVYAEVDE